MMSRWNRKLWALILAAGMTVSLAACGGSHQAAGGASAGTQDGTAAQQNQSTGSNTDNAGSTVTLAQDARALQIIDDNYRTYYELLFIPSMTVTATASVTCRESWTSWTT